MSSNFTSCILGYSFCLLSISVMKKHRLAAAGEEGTYEIYYIESYMCVIWVASLLAHMWFESYFIELAANCDSCNKILLVNFCMYKNFECDLLFGCYFRVFCLVSFSWKKRTPNKKVATGLNFRNEAQQQVNDLFNRPPIEQKH